MPKREKPPTPMRRRSERKPAEYCSHSHSIILNTEQLTLHIPPHTLIPFTVRRPSIYFTIRARQHHPIVIGAGDHHHVIKITNILPCMYIVYLAIQPIVHGYIDEQLWSHVYLYIFIEYCLQILSIFASFKYFSNFSWLSFRTLGILRIFPPKLGEDFSFYSSLVFFRTSRVFLSNF